MLSISLSLSLSFSLSLSLSLSVPLSFLPLFHLDGLRPLAQHDEAGLAFTPHRVDAGAEEDSMARLVGRQVGNAGPDPARLGLGGDEGGVAVTVGQGVGGRGFRLGGGFTLRGGGRLGPLRRSKRARERGWKERGGRGGWSSAPSPSPHRRRARAFNSPASPPSPQPGRWLWPPTWRGRPLRRWGLWPDDEGGRGGGRRVRGGGERVDRPACAAGSVSVSLSLSLCLSHRRAVQTRGGQGNGGCVGGSGGWVGHLERERE